jgi:hypothetical protein
MAEGTCMHCGRDIGSGHEPRCPYRANELNYLMSRLWRAEQDRTTLERAATEAIALADAGNLRGCGAVLRQALAVATAKGPGRRE